MQAWRIRRDRRVALAPRLLRRLEGVFSAQLDTLPVWFAPTQEAPGLAVGGAILLGPAAFAAGGPRPLALLAHEIAHVLQQQRHGRAGTLPPALAEAEARAATRAALVGRRFRVRGAIDSRSVACWGEAGHYYTTYFVLLAAGVDDARAFKSAFYCQLPDEVSDLDAVAAGIRMALMSMTPAKATTPNYNRMEGGFAKYLQLMDVQRGLHSLTGSPAELETSKRTATLLSLKGGTLEYGLALHAFGDSFAHRKGDKMYAAPLGHGPDGHEPDILGPHRRALFHRYVRLMHAIALRTFPNRARNAAGKPWRIDAERTVQVLDKALKLDGPKGDGDEANQQIPAIRMAAFRELAGQAMNSGYKPELREDKPFRYWHMEEQPYLVSSVEVQAAERCGSNWSWGVDPASPAAGLSAEELIERVAILP